MVSSLTKGFIIGIVTTIIIVIGLWITFIFSDYLLKYSGITMFYSLIAVFIILIISETLKKKKEREEDEILLRSILRVTRQVEADIRAFGENLLSKHVPPTNLGQFVVDMPLEIRNKSTKKLDNLLVFANDKIETLNNWREGYFEIQLEPNKTERERLIKRYREFWSTAADIAFTELKKAIEDIKLELGRWLKLGE